MLIFFFKLLFVNHCYYLFSNFGLDSENSICLVSPSHQDLKNDISVKDINDISLNEIIFVHRTKEFSVIPTL